MEESSVFSRLNDNLLKFMNNLNDTENEIENLRINKEINSLKIQKLEKKKYLILEKKDKELSNENNMKLKLLHYETMTNELQYFLSTQSKIIKPGLLNDEQIKEIFHKYLAFKVLTSLFKNIIKKKKINNDNSNILKIDNKIEKYKNKGNEYEIDITHKNLLSKRIIKNMQTQLNALIVTITDDEKSGIETVFMRLKFLELMNSNQFLIDKYEEDFEYIHDLFNNIVE